MTGSRGMDLPALVSLVTVRRWRIIAFAILGAAAAVALSLAQRDRFEASAYLLFGRTTSADAVFSGATSDSSGVEGQAATTLALASLDTVAERVSRRLPGRATVRELKDSVDIELQGQANLVRVTAQRSSPEQAAAVANGFADEIVALRQEVARAEVVRAINAVRQRIAAAQAQASASGSGGGQPGTQDSQLTVLQGRLAQLEVLDDLTTGDVQIVERATLPQEPSSPKPVRNGILGAVIGLVLGVCFVVLRDRFAQRLQSEDEVVALVGAPVLARIPRLAHGKRLPHPWSAPEVAEAFEFLRLNLQHSDPHGRGLVVTVTSPGRGAGKTTVASGLARALAATRVQVVAVDLDLRNPSLEKHFALVEGHGGVLDALDRSQSLEHLARPTEIENLRVVPGGGAASEAVQPVLDRAFWQLVGRLRGLAQYVVLDTAPVSSVAQTSVVAAASDGVLIVVDLDVLQRRELVDAVQQLRKTHAKILGAVLQRTPPRFAAYYGTEPGSRDGAARLAPTAFSS